MILISKVEDVAKENDIHKPNQEELDDIFRSEEVSKKQNEIILHS